MTALRWRAARGLLLSGVAATIACRHHGEQQAASMPIARDSLVGIVSVTGTSFEKRLMLLSDGRSIYLLAFTSDSAALSRVGGTEVVVRGLADPSAFRVANFTVRAVDNRPVADGVLRRDGERIVLETANSSILLGNPPTALRTMIGARVWIGGAPATGPNVYGVIVPAP